MDIRVRIYCHCQVKFPSCHFSLPVTKSSPEEIGDYWVICGRGIVDLAYWNGEKWIIKNKKHLGKKISFCFRKNR